MNKKLNEAGKTYKNNEPKNSEKKTKKPFDNKTFRTDVWQKQLDELMDFKSDIKTYVNPQGELHEIIDISDISEFKNKKEIEKIIVDIYNRFIEDPCSNLDYCILRLLKTIGELCGIDRASLFLFHSNYRFVTNTHEWCAEEIESPKDKLQDLPTIYYLWTARKTLNKEAIIINDVEELPEKAVAERLMLSALAIKSLAATPIIINKKPVGFIEFESYTEKRNWDKEIVSMLKAISGIIGIALVLNKD